jgi:hypothetical protein
VTYYAGLDVSLEETAICVVDDARRAISQVVPQNEPDFHRSHRRRSAPDLADAALTTSPARTDRWKLPGHIYDRLAELACYAA